MFSHAMRRKKKSKMHKRFPDRRILEGKSFKNTCSIDNENNTLLQVCVPDVLHGL